MATQTTDPQVFGERLDKLERQNRRLRNLAAAALLLAVVGLLLGPGRGLLPRRLRINRVLEGESLVLKDRNGHPLVILGPEAKGGADLDLFGPDGIVDLSSESGLNITGHPGGMAHLQIDKDGPQLSLYLLGRGTGAQVGVPFPSVATLSATRDGPSLALLGDAPSLTLHDKAGYSAVLGTGDLVNNKTGETSKTSAASLLMFGKDNHTIWRAP